MAFLLPIATIAAGMANYAFNTNQIIPSTPAEWRSLLLSSLLIGLGTVSKDASTGSKAGAFEATLGLK